MVGIGIPGALTPKKKPKAPTVEDAAGAAGIQPVAPAVPPPAPGGLGAAPTPPHPDALTPRVGATPPDQQGQAEIPVGGRRDVDDGTDYVNREPPPPPAEGGASTIDDPASIDDLAEDFIRGQMTGEANTAEDEALIRELMAQEIGAGSVGNRASMGRAGMASSGALGAMQADAERAARQAATQDILGLRRDASQQAIDNAIAAGQLDIGYSDAATREREARAKELALEAMLAGEDYAAPGDGDVDGGPVDTVQDAAQDAFQENDEAMDEIGEALGVGPTAFEVVSAGDVPDGAMPVPPIVAGGITYDVYTDGMHFWLVEK